MRLLKKHVRDEAGVTLIEVLIAAAGGALILWFASSFLVNITQYIDKVLLSSDIVDMRDQLVSSYDCEKTLTGSQRTDCLNQKSIEVRSERIGARPLIKALSDPGGATRVGRYALQATCTLCPNCAGGRAVKVYYSELKSDISDSEWRYLDYDKLEWTDLLQGMDLGCSL